MPTPHLAPLLSLDRPVAIAHRGGSRLRPENTLDAFTHAVTLGVDAIECDVHLSRDGQVVVIHDETLDRTTDASGPVRGYSADELARVDAAARFSTDGGPLLRGTGIGVPRLIDVLLACPGMPFIIEIKGDHPERVPIVLEAIQQAGALNRVILGGFSWRVLDAVRRQAAGLLTSASRVEVQSALRRSYFFLGPSRPRYQVFQVPFRLKGKQIIGPGFVRAARRAGLPVQAWIVDEVSDMRRLLDWGVTGIISDRPDVAVAEVAAWRARPSADTGRLRG